MKYLSIDLEATGLEEDALIIEFAMVPFDAKTKTLQESLSKQFYLRCPSFEELEPKLNPWVKENNKELIQTAHREGIDLTQFKQAMENYLQSPEVKEYFEGAKVMLFGKSLSAIDIPFLNRDLGWEWMNKYFHHRNLDLSCFTLGLIDLGLLEKGMDSGSKLMTKFNMGEVAHTALEDAIHTVELYFCLLNLLNEKMNSTGPA